MFISIFVICFLHITKSYHLVPTVLPSTEYVQYNVYSTDIIFVNGLQILIRKMYSIKKSQLPLIWIICFAYSKTLSLLFFLAANLAYLTDFRHSLWKFLFLVGKSICYLRFSFLVSVYGSVYIHFQLFLLLSMGIKDFD